MGDEKFPLILSPNLGCPRIISVEELLKGKTIDIIIAGQYGESVHPKKEMFKDVFRLVSSFPEDIQNEIYLDVNEEIEELTEWNMLIDFKTPDETQRLINSEIHYNILGEVTKYWLIKAVLRSPAENILRKKKERLTPTLYDLVLCDKPGAQDKINYHAVQFVEKFNALNFIHLTDLHIAQRNDEILSDVLKIERNEDIGSGVQKLISGILPKKHREEIRSRGDIIKSYRNFNDNFRKFINKANSLADQGELDFIVMTGDIVDFAGLGWYEDISTNENNWKIFFDIVTGHVGIKVAIFTSTGNHDWRMHPYSLLPYYGPNGEFGKFGLNKEEARNYNYKSFDSMEFPTDRRKVLSDALAKESMKRLNLEAMEEPFLKISTKILGPVDKLKNIFWQLLLGLGASGAAIGKILAPLGVLKGLVIGALFPIAVWLIYSQVKKYSDLVIDNPIHAEVKALHYYFMHINPYFDYAFSVGDNHFILMDTGADVVTIGLKELMDGKKLEHLKKVSFQDNIFGSSPDSMAFDDRQAYNNWAQIVWLDKALSCVSNKINKKGRGKSFICVHAPPINYDPNDKDKLEKLSETNNQNKPISFEDCNLTYGTINHYLSQFFFLCRGLRENPHRRIDRKADSDLRKVDLVLSGHAHIDVEFRLEIDKNDPEESKIRIYYDKYSSKYSPDPDDPRTFIVQTAACGPHSDKDKTPPYWRKVIVDENNNIKSFKQECL